MASPEDRTTWNRCTLCDTRQRTTMVRSGHCCAGCIRHLENQLGSLLQLATDAAADVTPRTGSGSGGQGFESKPPISLDNAAPHLAMIELTPGDHDTRVTITDALASWEIVIRSERDLAPYGAATEAHAGDRLRGFATSEVTLAARAFTQSVGFLTRNLEWITTEFSTERLVQFDLEVSAACSAIRRMLNSGGRDRVVSCPTLTAAGTCGNRITVRTWAALDDDPTTGETTHCPRCGAVRTATQLMRSSGSDETWADAESLALHFGISQTVIRKWARAGHVQRANGLYRWSDVQRRHEIA